MKERYEEIIKKLERYNQNEIISLLENQYSEEEKNAIVSQLEKINIEKITTLYSNATSKPDIDENKIEHIKCKDICALSESQFGEYKKIGEEIIKANKYGVPMKRKKALLCSPLSTNAY